MTEELRKCSWMMLRISASASRSEEVEEEEEEMEEEASNKRRILAFRRSALKDRSSNVGHWRFYC